MRQTAVGFKSKGLTLEGVLASPAGDRGPFPAVVVAHGHPHLGATMESALVLNATAKLVEAGFAAFRFNFRGVGDSEGEFTNGKAEPQDVKAALEFIGRLPEVDRKAMAVVGYSFGASMAAVAAPKVKRVKAGVLVSPPPSVFDSAGSWRKVLLLIVAGSNDKLTPVDGIEGRIANFGPDTQLNVIDGADHSWTGYESLQGEAVARFLAESM